MLQAIASSFLFRVSIFGLRALPVTAIILAAGKSTRMNSARPKPLHEVCGRPMLWYVLRACYDAGCEKVMVVVGHGRDEITTQFGDDRRIIWIDQAQQLGSGHAARMCEKHLKKIDGDVFVLAGDAPLIRGEVLRTLLEAHREDSAAASMATAVFDNPYGFARIVRDAKGDFSAIVEESEATAEQRAIKEVFPAYYCVNSTELVRAIAKLTPDKSKREYYLSDIFAILMKQGKKIVAVQAVEPEDTLTVNTRQQLAEIDLVMQDRIQRQMRDNGVTIVSSYNTYIETGASIGKDTVIHPFSFVGRDCTIGPECTIGPFARIPRDAVIPESTTILGHPAQDTGMMI